MSCSLLCQCTMIADSALLRVDTAKYVVPLESEAKKRWNDRVMGMAEACGWENVEQVELRERDSTISSFNELVFVRKATPNS